MISLRDEQPGDEDGVRELTRLAFDGPVETAIIDALREACPGLLSLVAVDNGRIVGHILFSPVTVKGERGKVTGSGLAPMAVLPGHQRRGIGSALVRTGLARLWSDGCPFVVVLGHPGYYPRFGFVPASRYGLTCQWEGVPNEAFMVIVPDEVSLRGVSGVARYRDEFNAAME